MAKEKKRGEPKLPTQQLAILAAVRFAEPLALTSVFPYLPEMIKGFGVPQEEVARWAGIISAAFSLCQSLTAVPWGWASDRIGRKPTMIMGLLCTMVCFLLWGVSSSLFMAIAFRCIQGATSGNVGIIRTMVAEMVPQRALQPRAFSIMPMVWSVGSVFGPSFGGFFARPAEQFPRLFGNFELFKRFPFLLPNLIAFVFFVISTLFAVLFLEETLESRKHRKDWGLEVGERITRVFRCGKPSKESLIRSRARARAQAARARIQARTQTRTGHGSRRGSFVDDEAHAPLLSSNANHSTAHLPLGGALSPTTTRDDSNQLAKAASEATSSSAANTLGQTTLSSKDTSIFTYQIWMALVAYMLLAVHAVAYDQVLPVFLNYPHETHDASNTQLPFKFSGGFGLSSGRIGTIFTVNALISGFAQFVAFPPLCTRFGALNCFRFSSILLPFVYIVTPYSTLIEDERWRYAAFMTAFVLKGIICIVTFPCVTLILTNSAPSVKVLGTLNGLATLVSGLGRGFGPAVTGAVFSWGVQHGYIIAGWAFLAGMAVLSAISTFFLQEGDGIEAPSDSSANGDEEMEDEEDGPHRSGRGLYSDDDDNDYDSYEESLLDDLDEDEEDFSAQSRGAQHSHGQSLTHSPTHSRTNSRAWTTTTDTPLPAPTASLFTSSPTTPSEGASDATPAVGSDSPGSSPTRLRHRLSQHHQHTTAATRHDLREPEDPGSDDLDAMSAVVGLGLGIVADCSAQVSTPPVQTRRFRSVSSLSRRGREDSRAGDGNAVAMSSVAPPPESKHEE